MTPRADQLVSAFHERTDDATCDAVAHDALNRGASVNPRHLRPWPLRCLDTDRREQLDLACLLVTGRRYRAALLRGDLKPAAVLRAFATWGAA